MALMAFVRLRTHVKSVWLQPTFTNTDVGQVGQGR